MQIMYMVHGMYVQFCDDGHHTAQHDWSTNASRHCAHANCLMLPVLFKHSCVLCCMRTVSKEHAINWILLAVLIGFMTHICYSLAMLVYIYTAMLHGAMT